MVPGLYVLHECKQKNKRVTGPDVLFDVAFGTCFCLQILPKFYWNR
jgi:hypothetical protein